MLNFVDKQNNFLQIELVQRSLNTSSFEKVKYIAEPGSDLTVQDVVGDDQPYDKRRGVILMLTKEDGLERATETIKRFEKRFNKQFKYPYLIMNNVPFSENFATRIASATENTIEFAVIPPYAWKMPDFIDQTKMETGMNNLCKADRKVPYCDSVSYRKMCRFYSGPVFTLPELDKYDWFWRLDDDVTYLCDIQYDPFEFMYSKNIVYGFSLTQFEFLGTVPSLFGAVAEYASKTPTWNEPWLDKLKKGSENIYNGCHFWTNMEMGSLKFFRSEPYQSYFKFLDETGGFFYERWGDAPVRTLGLAALVDRNRVHYFDDIYYIHSGMFRLQDIPGRNCHLPPEVASCGPCVTNLIGLPGRTCAEYIQ